MLSNLEGASGLIPPTSEDAPGVRLPRVLGRVLGAPGPTVVVVGGLHGNEPAGALGLARVCARLAERDGHDVTGEVVGLTGNLKALAANRRYLREDLNRIWLPDRIARVRRPVAVLQDEDEELAALDHELTSAAGRARGPFIVFDVHGMSAPGPAFVTLDDTLQNRALAFHLPSPCVLGLEEELHGTLTDYFVRAGVTSFGFESGQLYDPRSIDRAEAAIWLVLEAAGVVDRRRWPEVERADAVLRADRGPIPPVVEVRHRHAIAPAARFRMQPGYRSFAPIRAGDTLGSSDDVPVLAPMDGLILMPLYQAQGSDGFFVVRPVRPIWLQVSAVARRLPLSGALAWLPGVRRHPDEPGSFIVDTRRARWLALQLFHLLGFTRRARLPHGLVMGPRGR